MPNKLRTKRAIEILAAVLALLAYIGLVFAMGRIFT
jgi:hypothetical protein